MASVNPEISYHLIKLATHLSPPFPYQRTVLRRNKTFVPTAPYNLQAFLPVSHPALGSDAKLELVTGSY